MKHKMRQGKGLFWIILLVGSLFSCQAMMFGILGIRNPEKKTSEEKIRFTEKLGVPSNSIFEYDNLYLREYDTVKDFNNSKVKGFIQPLQLQFYNSTGDLILHYKNCDAPGAINIKWNHYGIFDSIPPKKHFGFYADSVYRFSQQKSFIKPLGRSSLNSFEFQNYDYTLIVVWSSWMHRQSKRLIKKALEFQKTHSEKKIKLVFINFDEYFTNDSSDKSD